MEPMKVGFWPRAEVKLIISNDCFRVKPSVAGLARRKKDLCLVYIVVIKGGFLVTIFVFTFLKKRFNLVLL